MPNWDRSAEEIIMKLNKRKEELSSVYDDTIYWQTRYRRSLEIAYDIKSYDSETSKQRAKELRIRQERKQKEYEREEEARKNKIVECHGCGLSLPPGDDTFYCIYCQEIADEGRLMWVDDGPYRKLVERYPDKKETPIRDFFKNIPPSLIPVILIWFVFYIILPLLGVY